MTGENAPEVYVFKQKGSSVERTLNKINFYKI